MRSYPLNAKGNLGGAARSPTRPLGPEPVGGGPEGTGIQWRITSASSLTRTSLTRSRTIRCRSTMSSVSADARKRVRNAESVSARRRCAAAVASLFHQRVQLLSQRLLALTQQRHPLA